MSFGIFKAQRSWEETPGAGKVLRVAPAPVLHLRACTESCTPSVFVSSQFCSSRGLRRRTHQPKQLHSCCFRAAWGVLSCHEQTWGDPAMVMHVPCFPSEPAVWPCVRWPLGMEGSSRGGPRQDSFPRLSSLRVATCPHWDPIRKGSRCVQAGLAPSPAHPGSPQSPAFGFAGTPVRPCRTKTSQSSRCQFEENQACASSCVSLKFVFWWQAPG